MFLTGHLHTKKLKKPPLVSLKVALCFSWVPVWQRRAHCVPIPAFYQVHWFHLLEQAESPIPSFADFHHPRENVTSNQGGSSAVICSAAWNSLPALQNCKQEKAEQTNQILPITALSFNCSNTNLQRGPKDTYTFYWDSSNEDSEGIFPFSSIINVLPWMRWKIQNPKCLDYKQLFQSD